MLVDRTVPWDLCCIGGGASCRAMDVLRWARLEGVSVWIPDALRLLPATGVFAGVLRLMTAMTFGSLVGNEAMPQARESQLDLCIDDCREAARAERHSAWLAVLVCNKSQKNY